MLATLLCKEKLYGILLPEKIRGRYWIEDSDVEHTNSDRLLLSIEGQNNVWRINAGKKLNLYSAEQLKPVSQLELEEGKMYPIELSKGRKCYLFTESYTQASCTFKKYFVDSDNTINIGKAQGNQIIIDNPYVSPVHAQLLMSGNKWIITDNNSKNGVYVNEKRLEHSSELRPGDVLYILGVKIVFGYHFLALNNPNGIVSINTDILKPYKPQVIQSYEIPEKINNKIYYRSPRFSREIVPLKLKIDGPTMQERGDDTPLALSLAPSLVMGVASFSSGLLAMMTAVRNGGRIISAIPTFVMALAMLAGMVVFPFVMKKRDRQRKKERELERRTKYLKYLENIHAEIYKASNQQHDILNESYPYVLSQIKNKDFYDLVLWSRIMGQKNFLMLRVGMGNIPLQAELSFPELRFGIDDDIMRQKVNQFSEEKQVVSDVPVVFSLVEHRISGIVGNAKAVNGILHHLLVQIAALHSYDEVKIVFLCDELDLKKYDYVRWMPHIWDNHFKMRFLATNSEEVRNLSAHFLREMEKYLVERKTYSPQYVVISTSKTLSDSCAFLAELLKNNKLDCFSYLAVYDELKNLPKECTTVFEINDTQGMMFNYKVAGGGQINFVQDIVSQKEASKAVMEIAEYKLDLQGGKYKLPDMLTFLDMFQVGKYEHLNVTNRWKTSNSVASLQTPIGVNSDGGLFYLDLHEAAHGPHGLIAGMTGSGKSEFIITYILSMAVNYSPEDIAFILIDYKGGGLVGAFEGEQYHLPHIAGTITNLDGAAITRSLLSIQSELKKRQRIFAQARQKANEGTMDIYKYQKLYRNGIVSEPLPHLVIISDEFAELKSQQPEFMDQLISTARIGRSLGVHLILATQKPSGVVSDQIWANSKFKVSLKVQDRADSMEMLKRPDAAELVETGRFYMQVGYNELFEIGQSAWCGAPYIPTETTMTEIDDCVQMIDHQGNVVEEAKPQRKVIDLGQSKKQIVEIVQYLEQIAEEEQIKAKPLWLPEIPARVSVKRLEEKYQYRKGIAMNPIIGELDDPFNQEQKILTLPLGERGNAICYGNAVSGKEEFLTTILYSLYRSYTSDELNAYILDFGSETLQVFEGAPQTGGIVFSGEDEKVGNLFQMLRREVVKRKKQFAQAGGDYLSYRKLGYGDVPAIVVVMNEYANFAEQYEAWDDQMSSLTRDCTKYGIYFIITNPSQTGIRYKLQQNFSQMYVLQMNDKSDYISILGSTGGVYPSPIYGRGIVREKNVYEFQTACVAEVLEQTMDVVKKFCGELRKNSQKKAKLIPVLPKAVLRQHFGEINITYERVPIGLYMSTSEPACINLKKESVCQVLAMDRQDTVAFTEGLANMLCQDLNYEIYVIDPGQILSVAQIDKEHYITEQIEDIVIKLFWLTVERHNSYKEAADETNDSAYNSPVIVIFMGLGQIKKLLSEDGKDKLRLILEKTSGRFGLSFWIVDDYQSSNTYCAECWCTGDGIWIGNGIGDQIRFKINRKNLSHARNLDFTSGFWVRKANAHPLKLLVSERMEEEEEDYE